MIRNRIRTEQRAGRWRAACTLLLWDGWENNNGTYTSKYSTGTDPTEMDTDADGLTDGQEVDGWDVAVYFQATKEAKGDPWHVTSDPNTKHSDDDLMTDYEEFMNGSDPNKNDTDGDKILDHEEFLDDDDENTPTAFDGVAPKLDKFCVSTVKEDDWFPKYRMEISVRARDIAGVDWVYIKVSGQKSKTEHLAGEKEMTITVNFKLDWGRSFGGGYDVHLKSCDVNGNEMKTKKHIPGILESIANAILKALMAAAKFIAELASAFIDFIWGAISSMMDTVFKPIVDGIIGYVKGIGQAFNAAYEDFQQTNSLEESTVSNIKSAIFPQFVELILIIIQIIMAIINIVTPFLLIVSSLLNTVADFIAPMILNAFTSVAAGDKNTFPEMISTVEIINYIQGYLGFDDSGETKGWPFGPFTSASLFFTFLGAAISWLSVQTAKKANQPVWGGNKKLMSLLKSPAGGLLLSIFGCIISIFSITFLTDVHVIAQLAVTIIGILISMIGFGISGLNLIKATGADKIFSIGGVIVGLGGALAGAASVSEIKHYGNII